MFSFSLINVIVNNCPGGDRCLHIKYHRRISVSGRSRTRDWLSCITVAWYQALGPDSYNLREDEESVGILWCAQRGYRNYVKYLQKALLRRICIGSVVGTVNRVIPSC